jgi:nitrogen fixation protein NifU and related proteins
LGYDNGMYSELVLDHFRNPRNTGRLENATARVQATNPVCGDILELAARVENGGIAEARFLCRGCTTSIACASFLTERLTGCSVAAARSITAESISESLGGLPPATFHGAQLAADALSLLLEKVA